jgi:hypothetical protein
MPHTKAALNKFRTNVLKRLPVVQCASKEESKEPLLEHHTYFSLLDTLAFFLALGLPLDAAVPLEVPPVVDRASCCKRVVRIALSMRTDGEALSGILLWIEIWMDDIDFQNSFKNKSGTWTLLVRFSCPPEAKGDERYTHVLAVGAKGSNHEEVIRELCRELRLLRKGKQFFHGALHAVVMVYGAVHGANPDTPERFALAFQSSAQKGLRSGLLGRVLRSARTAIFDLPGVQAATKVLLTSERRRSLCQVLLLHASKLDDFPGLRDEIRAAVGSLSPFAEGGEACDVELLRLLQRAYDVA